jgi:thiol-disulfide isomerase/thioredoxin
MKRYIISFLFLVFFSISVSSQEVVPVKFHGTWLIDGINKGDWDAITVTDNHIEFFYDLYLVDSVIARPAGSQFYLSNEKGKRTSVVIEKSSDSVATFKYNEWNAARTCTLVTKHPDMVYYDAANTHEILKGNWIIGRDIKNVMSVSNQKIQLDGKTWNIIWFGQYLGREYRALLQNEQKYQLVYLKRNGRMLSISGAGRSYNYALKAKNDHVYDICGNWYNPLSNQWTFGFTEDFAIYDGKFWNYEMLKPSGNRIDVVLQNGNRKIPLQISKTNDSLLDITSADKKMVSYKLAGKTLPAYSSGDQSIFKDSRFQKIDTAYITGYVRNKPNNDPIVISYRSILTHEDEKFVGEVDETGKFLIKVPLINTSIVYYNSGIGTTFDVIEPGERYFMYYDFANQQHLIMGVNSRIHNELANYVTFKAFQNEDDQDNSRKLKGLEFLKAKRSELSKANTFSESYFDSRPNLSEKAKTFIESFNRYYIAIELMQKRFELDRANQEKFPEEYMSYVKDSLMANVPSPFTIAYGIPLFTRDYVEYYQQFEPQVSILSDRVILDLITSGKIKTSPEEKASLIVLATTEMNNKVDAVQKKKIRDSVGLDKIALYGNLRSQNKEVIQTRTTQLLWQTVLDQEMAFYDKILQNEELRKTFQASAIYSYLERTREALDSKKFASLIKRVEAPAITDKLTKYQTHLLQMPSQDFAYAESIKRTSHLKGAKNADSLLKALLLPYKGKVVYIDFWGTWCGPCREEMKYVAAAKEAVKDKDVIFMYLANNSPEPIWKNMIKDLNLTGKNVVHYRLPEGQQYLIENRLSIQAFPTYMLVDKNGNIVNSAAPRPSNPEGLRKEIEELSNR